MGVAGTQMLPGFVSRLVPRVVIYIKYWNLLDSSDGRFKRVYSAP